MPINMRILRDALKARPGVKLQGVKVRNVKVRNVKVQSIKVQSCVLGCLMVTPLVQADEDFWHASVAARQTWDSNFSRKPIADEEEVTHSTATLGVRENFGRQQLSANWQVHKYDHQTYSDFDGTTHSGDINWKGELGSAINTQLKLSRDAYMVDRFEFFGNDRVDRDELSGRIGYGNNQRLSFHVGGRGTQQRHSNGLRAGLDFDEEEAYVDVGYQTSSRSTFILRTRAGNRSYLNDPLTDDLLGSSPLGSSLGSDPLTQLPGPDTAALRVDKRDLDFDYTQGELESQWVLSPKTRLSFTLARYKREGELNDAKGSLATFSGQWQATEKLAVTGGYSYREPALGESSDAPTKIHESFVAVQWDLSHRLRIGTEWRYGSRHYENRGLDNAGLTTLSRRDEKLYIFSPLSVSYSLGDHWQVRLDTGWRKNESPIEARRYISRTAAVGLVFSI